MTIKFATYEVEAPSSSDEFGWLVRATVEEVGGEFMIAVFPFKRWREWQARPDFVGQCERFGNGYITDFRPTFEGAKKKAMQRGNAMAKSLEGTE